MSQCGKWNIVFCVAILLELCNAFASNEGIFDHMSVDEKKSFFGTDDGSVPEFELVELPKTPRSKRAARTTLDITFNAFGISTTSSMNLVDDRELISRTTSMVFFAYYEQNAYHRVKYVPSPDVLGRIGDFDLFQNINDCSAVTRFWDPAGDEIITGILKQDYSVKTMPRGPEDGFVNIVRQRIVKRSTNSSEPQDENSSQILVIFKNPEEPLNHFPHQLAPNSFDPDLQRGKRQNAAPNTNNNNYVPSIVYPKLLISPDYRLVSRERSVDAFIRQLIAHMNAVDMVYRQLRDPVVRIKIAAIIIPQDAFATPYISANTLTAQYLIGNDVLAYTRQYFLDESRRFTFNYYNTVVLMTTNSLWAREPSSGNYSIIQGQAIFRSGCFLGRAVTTYARGLIGVANMAHELGHVFGAFDEPMTQCLDTDGFTMVSNAGLMRSLKWSTCSQQSISSYFRSQEAVCMHLKPAEMPDALKSLPGAWLPSVGQCDNVFNNPTSWLCNTLNNQRRGCAINNTCVFLEPFPMEGTLLPNGQRWINNQTVWTP